MPDVSPLWRRSVLRSLPPRGWGLLLVAALLAATTSAASVPFVVEQTADDALASTLAVVPQGARLADSSAVRVVGGRSPRSEDSELLRQRLDAIPGLEPSTLTALSIGPDTHGGTLFRPLVRVGDRSERARLAAVADPAASLDVTASDPAVRSGAWLPEPVADELGVRPGDTIELLVQQYDDARPAPSDAPPPTVATLPVAGVYAVAADGRRPADPPGTATWSRRAGVLPTDSDLQSLPAYLVVTDVATADRTAEAIGDDLLWAVESELEPGVSLATAQTTAAEVAELRTDVRAVDGESVGPLRLGLASGLEVLVAQATSLANATADRVRLLTASGIAAGLLVLLALAVLLARDRRQELQHGAAVGVGPVRVGSQWLLESVLPAAVAAAAGVGCAWLLLRSLAADASPSSTAMASAWTQAGLVAAAGAVVVAAVGATACAVGERPESIRGRRRVPWVALLTVLTATALVAAITTPASSPGPVALAVPALVAVTIGALLATIVAALLRLRRAATLPGSVAAAARWLAVRRLARAGGEQVLAVAAMTLGLAMVLFAVSAVAATRTVVADRTAVLAGATSSAQLYGSWVLDPHAAETPTTAQVEAGRKVPPGHSPTVRPGDTVLWRSVASVDGDFGYRDLLVIEPSTFDAAADWGAGDYLRDVRAATAELAAEGSASVRDVPVPVIAVNDPALSEGDVVTISGQQWESRARVIATVTAFPGQGSKPMLVATVPSLMPRWGRNDPRLVPAPGFEAPRTYAEAWVWSSRDVADLTASLEARGVSPTGLASAEQASRAPALVASESTLGIQLVLAGFLSLAAIVAAALHSRRVAQRSRAADAMLARTGMSTGGVRRARTWESLLLVGLALVSAIAAVAAVTRIGALLLDLDRSMTPAFVLQLSPQALLVTVVCAVVMLVVAWWVGARSSGGGRGRSPEEVVLRDGR